MPRTRSRRKKNKDLYTFDSTLRKLKTVFEDKYLFLTQGGVAADVRQRVMALDFTVLRNAAKRLSIANMCINCREQQTMPFLSPSREMGVPGFVVCKKGQYNRSYYKRKDKRSDELLEFINQTGFVYDPAREDDFIDFGKMLTREVLTIDQIAIELQRNRRGEVAAFWLLDGATIARCFEDGYQGNKEIAFVQETQGQVVATYTKEDLLFDYMFKRADIQHRGYGYSLLEQAVDLVTTLILGISYNRDLFIKDKVPKGFLAVQGEADRGTISALERYWYMAMQGIGAKFAIPILPTGKEGVSVDFKALGQSNKDMEYYKLMLFFLSLFAGVFGIDLAELGIKTDTTQQALGENIEGRVAYSKDRGIKSSLGFLAGIMNKIVRKVDEDYEFMFVGIDPEDEAKKYDVLNKAVQVRPLNQIYEENGWDPLEGEEYDIPWNQQLIQLKQLLAGQKQQEEMQGGEGGGEEYDEENWGAGEEEEQPAEEEEAEKAINNLEQHLESLHKAGYDMEIEL